MIESMSKSYLKVAGSTSAVLSSPLLASAPASLDVGIKARIGVSCAIDGLLAVLAAIWAVIVTKRLRVIQQPEGYRVDILNSHLDRKVEKGGNEPERSVRNVRGSEAEMKTR